MNIYKAMRRERKNNKKKNGMQVDGRSAFINQEAAKNRAEQLRKQRQQKEKVLELVLDN